MITVETCQRKININEKLLGVKWWFITRKRNPSLRPSMSWRFPVFADTLCRMRLSSCEDWALPCPLNLHTVLWGHRYYALRSSRGTEKRMMVFLSCSGARGIFTAGFPSYYFIFSSSISHSTNPCTFPLLSEFFAVFGKTTLHICFKCVRIVILGSRVMTKNKHHQLMISEYTKFG